ncbi:DUF885 domain-containing protein [Nitrospirillum viridazoti]|uniref:DUF885 domain-containing protein n=1 Tax=Nitrospirillum viridazoti CBAmc TaxID=1441467 RepID=A0A248JY36_9PROT|nr:DUF885 family protein [Nitrospirillum amazonense]ASG23460.1 DUF885 domain-containing protein [Nitrospirillum amazonense CBAmc]TWB39847.1 uncharacterized protein (DUF885 family) [Nitrospirillum amazonense]
MGKAAIFPLILMALLAPLAAEASPASLTPLIADYDALLQGGKEEGRCLPDVSPKAAAERRTRLAGFVHRLGAVDPTGLTPADRLTYRFMRWDAEDRLAGMAFDQERMPFNSDSGFYATLTYAASRTHVRTKAEAEAWLACLEAAPDYYAANIANARRGIATGFVQPRLIVDAVLDIARKQADTPLDEDGLLSPFAGSGDPAAMTEWRARARKVLADIVRPAQRDFVTFLEREYRPAAPESLAARDLPDGEAYYTWAVHHHTTTSLTPDAVHELGLKEVARIRGEMEALIRRTGFTGGFADFLAFLRTDPRFYVTTRQALLEKASEIAKRIDDQLPGHFGRLPRLTYGVREVPRDIEDTYTTGRYFPGDAAKGIAGGFMVNTGKLDQRPLYELPALALHEAVPGHHLQTALAAELEDLPSFRRHAYLNAYGEGWGLYSEQLGEEMGIYRDDYERFGRLSFDMWRACRLVADTGIHWKHWTLDQARACFIDNTALAPHNIETELRRYIGWPGQALAYKIGELKLLELRQRAQDRLGDRFNERAFHDAVLLSGSLPLDLLEDQVNAWIAAQGR